MIQLSAPGTACGFGVAVAGAGDVDADGLEEIAVGAANDTDKSIRGHLFVYYGAGTGLASTSPGASFNVQFATSVAFLDTPSNASCLRMRRGSCLARSLLRRAI